MNIRNIDVLYRLSKICGSIVNSKAYAAQETSLTEVCVLLDMLTQDYISKFKEHDIDYFDLRYMLDSVQNMPSQMEYMWEDISEGIGELRCFADGELFLYRQMTQAAYTDKELLDFDLVIEGA